MSVTRVGGYGAVALVHRPVVGETIDIVVLRLILTGGSLGSLTVDVVDCQVVYGTGDTTAEVDVLVVGKVAERIGRESDILICEEHHRGSLVLGKHREGHIIIVVAQGQEYPRVFWYRHLTDEGGLAERHGHFAVILDTQSD